MSSDDRRHITSATELRALSHPTRMALMYLLDELGPLTATQAGEQLGESAANASFHLRTLARYGYVEEAPGGRGRQRPWQLVPRAQSIDSDELDAEGRIAAGALLEQLRERDNVRLRNWEATRSMYPQEWRAGASEMRMSLHLTAAEMAELKDRFEALVKPYVEAGGWAAGRPGTVPVSLGLHLIPTRPPAADPASPETSEDPS